MEKKMTLSEYEAAARTHIQYLIDKYCYGSQQVFADRTGINKASVSQYVNGKNTPSSVTADKIAKAFGCAPEWVMGFTTKDSGNDLTEDEEMLLENYRKLSPVEQASINNIVDKMANGANGLDRVIEQKQEEPEVYTLDNAEVYVIKSDGTKARFINLGKTVKSPMEKYHPVPAERLIRAKASTSPRPRKLADIGNKVAKKKKG